ncbi:MAG: MmcQ/YjbR family DNA-binding protein [Clostridia bacterium]|nr:MmcQ/YjbR family DNA-binding protein [Clostridia bacterium]
MNRNMTEVILKYIEETYGASPEFLWKDLPDAAALRHPCGKWFGVWMRISRRKLGLAEEAPVEVLNLKRDPMLGLADGRRIFPAYHMNKEHWITVLLDGSVPFEELKGLIAMSYDMIENKRGCKKS